MTAPDPTGSTHACLREGKAMSMEYVRRYYGVPAKRGGRIRFDGQTGTILSATHHLRARMDDGTRVILHPTWRVDYLEETL